jgi:hypothetical protein
MRVCLLALLVLAYLAAGASAQTLDPSSEEALRAVLRMLQDPALRGRALASSPEAAAANHRLQSLAGGDAATVQDLYDLAGSIFEDLARGSGGDAQAMTRALTAAQSDPAAFAALLSPATLERLRALSLRLSDQPRR